jgi:hypothetical protein
MDEGGGLVLTLPPIRGLPERLPDEMSRERARTKASSRGHEAWR